MRYAVYEHMLLSKKSRMWKNIKRNEDRWKNVNTHAGQYVFLSF